MIRHVVIFDFEKNAPVDEIKNKILNLKNLIKEIKHIEVGIDVGFDPKPSDLCIITEVEDLKDLEIYAKHPDHIKVIEFIKPYVISRKVVDYKV